MTTVDRPRTEVPAPVVAPALTAAGLATVLIGVLLPMLDFFIVNVALPTMAVDLRASTAELELVVSGYATAYAVLLVVGGRLGDAFGRRRLFLVGMALFTLTSLLCGVAQNPTWLVVARLSQGLAAGLLTPQISALIQQLFRGPERGKAFGLFMDMNNMLGTDVEKGLARLKTVAEEAAKASAATPVTDKRK